DWSSDVCSSDLPPLSCTRRPRSAAQPGLVSASRTSMHRRRLLRRSRRCSGVHRESCVGLLIAGADAFYIEEVCVGAGAVFKALLHLLPLLLDIIRQIVDIATEEFDRRADHEMVVKGHGQVAVIGRAHGFMQLLAGANADDIDRK